MLLLLATLAAPAGCDEKPKPEFTKPLAQWRQTGVGTRTIRIAGGPTLQVPDSRELTCVEPTPSSTYTACGFSLDEATGRLTAPDAKPGTWLHVDMTYEHDRYRRERNAARINPEQWTADEQPAGQGAVLQSLESTTGGRHFAIGCWYDRQVGGNYTCTLVTENRSFGSTLVYFYPAAAPDRPGAPFDRPRLDRIIEIIADIDASFQP